MRLLKLGQSAQSQTHLLGQINPGPAQTQPRTAAHMQTRRITNMYSSNMSHVIPVIPAEEMRRFSLWTILRTRRKKIDRYISGKSLVWNSKRCQACSHEQRTLTQSSVSTGDRSLYTSKTLSRYDRYEMISSSCHFTIVHVSLSDFTVTSLLMSHC